MNSVSSHKLLLAAIALGFIALLPKTGAAQNTSPFPSSGNVGIGTTTPDQNANLHIYNPADNSGGGIDIQAAGSGGWSRLRLRTSTHIYGWFAGDASQPDAPNKIGLYDYTATAFRMMIDSSGNTGIGTVSPVELFHVRKDQNANTSILVENQTAGVNSQARIQAKNDLGNLAQIGMYSSTTNTYGAVAPNNAYFYTQSPGLVLMTDNPNGVIKFTTGGNIEKARIDSSGNIGIGTSNPSFGLQVEKTNSNGGNGWTAFFREAGKNGLLIGSRGSGNAIGSIMGVSPDLTAVADIALQPFGGNVAIGKSNPTVALDVQGDIRVSGNINAKYQDVAEWVPSSEKLPPGTVVVLDSTKSNQVTSSTVSYDTRVAGVISEQPGIALGEKSDSKVLVATTGRVRIKVDASKSPIQIGDLLVTSDIPGVAMKSEPIEIGGRKIHMPGTLIGKALEPLEKGSGKILVLLSLQ